MQVNPYLSFNGQCETAFKFYEQVLGGKIDAMMTFAGSPSEKEVPPEWGQKIMHAHLTLGDWTLMGSDCPPGHYEEPKGFSISLQINDPTEAERVFQTLGAGGTIQMPLEETFWAKRFGMLVDQFGTPWMVNCDPQ
jgi:PhnB protein